MKPGNDCQCGGRGCLDLIEFNFPPVAKIADFQEKCAVVNWYLRNNVGCTKSKTARTGVSRSHRLYLPAGHQAGVRKLKRIVIRTLADPSWPG